MQGPGGGKDGKTPRTFDVELSMPSATVSSFTDAFTRKTGVLFSYDASISDKVIGDINISVKNAALTDILDDVFSRQSTGFTYRSVNSTIVITYVGAASSTVTGNIVKGTVTDADGQPLIGAGVLVKGSSNGTMTDMDGYYELEVSPEETLVFSYIGCTEVEQYIGDRGVINVSLTADMNILDDVVVVGYGTQKKVNLTGAVSVVDGKDLQQRPVTNTAQALQGADPSLVLTMGSGSVEGTEYSVSIRGKLSINSGSPLIMIDGVEGSLSQINPNDIESISVLKDASACAIFGAKASAGVVLITTKSGSAGKTSVTYTGRVSVSKNTTSTDFITSSYDYITLCNEFYTYFKGYGAFTYTDEQIRMMEERRYDTVENPERPWVIPDETGKYTYVYLGNYDWYNFLFKRIRPETEHNISVRGGNDKIRYYASGRYLYKEGIFNNAAEDIYNSYSFRSKIDADVTSWLTYSNSISFERMDYNYGGFMELDGSTGLMGDGIMFNLTQNVGPMYTPYNPDGTINIQPGYMADATSPIFSGRGGVFMDGRNENRRQNNYITITNRFTFDITQGLKFIADYTYRRRDTNESYRSYPTANCYDNVNKRMYEGNGLTGGLFSNGSVYDFYRESRYYNDGHVINGYFQYSSSIGSHNISATAGGNFDDYRSSKLNIKQKGSLMEGLSFIEMVTNPDGTTNIEGANESISSYRTLGFFARANYDYKGKYLFEVSGRFDGSSRFPVNHRWGFFPSASAGWRISEESFWSPVKSWWNDAKLRISYGSLGNQQVSNYYYWELINAGILSYTLNGTSHAGYASITDPVSDSLTWETVITKNIGVDFGFFRNRLNLTADFYIRDTKNMLTDSMTLPAVFGAAAPKTNAADLRTTGYEISVSWRDDIKLAGKPFSYGVAASLGDSKSIITKFNNPNKLLSDHYEGKVLGDFWGYVTDGLFATDEEAAEYAAMINDRNVNKGVYAGAAPDNHLMAGDIKYVDLDGSKSIDTGSNTLADPGDRKVIGNSLPRYNYSFRGDIQWYGFDLQVFFQGVGQLDWMPSSNAIWFWNNYSYHRPSFIPKDFEEKCWSTEEGADNSDVLFPRRRGRIANSSNLVASDFWVQDASYIRLKNLTFGYTLPLKTKAVEKIRFYFSGENLWYWSPMKKWTSTVDPEVATTSASDDNMYPYSKTFSFGVDITF